MIQTHNLASRVLIAFGHTTQDEPKVILREERSSVWNLVGVKDILALKKE